MPKDKKNKTEKGDKKKKKTEPEESKGIVDSITGAFLLLLVIIIIFSFSGKQDPRKPIKGCGPRIKNIAFKHYRGIIGVLVPICVLCWQGKKGKNDITVQCMWMWMFWFFLLQPVSIPVTGLIPIFLLPMTGAMSTPDTCSCYMNENIALFILANMLLLLLNNSGMDRRIALWFLCSGDACQFSAKRLIFKCSLAAFFLSMFSNRLIVTNTLFQYMTPVFANLQVMTGKSKGTEPNYNEVRYIVCNSIQTAAAIGSTAIMHSAYATLAFRAIWCESAPKGKEYPDIFNYLHYSAYAFPTAVIMLILNFTYHMILINRVICKPMSSVCMAEARKVLLNYKSSIPSKVTVHEKLTLFFALFALLLLFLRWSSYLNMGWSGFRKEDSAPEIPVIKDATVAAMFVIFLHICPRSFGFLKYLSADKKSELPPLKPESAVLWWRFVDRNMNYGYIFLLGSGVALQRAIQLSGLDRDLSDNFGKGFTNPSWGGGLFLVCFIAMILANIMSGVAACVIFLPFVINMSLAAAAASADAGGGGGAGAPPAAPGLFFRTNAWPTKSYIGAVGVGVASSFGFMFPFMYTPAYFCHYTAKVPMKKMAKYSLGSLLICLIILWISLIYWAPYIWDPNDQGVTSVAVAAASNSSRFMA